MTLKQRASKKHLEFDIPLSFRVNDKRDRFILADNVISNQGRLEIRNGIQRYNQAPIGSSGDIVSVYAKYLASSNGQFYYTSSEAVGYLRARLVEPLVDYVKNPYQIDYYQVDLTVTGTNWTTTRAVGLIYKDPNGVWRLRLNIVGSFSGSTASGAGVITINGVTFKNVSNYYPPLHGDNGGSSWMTGQLTINGSTVTVWSGSNYTGVRLSGDVELESKPSII